jgi:hypothetical protein
MRSCIFCSERASSKEDAWPKWLMQYFPSGGSINVERGERALNTWHAEKPRLEIRYVCAKCNNTWMSELENSVKPIILSIIENELDLIEYESQKKLSLWAVKNAMVYEYLYPKRYPFYTESERHSFHNEASMPENTNVWIAKCVDFPGVYTEARDYRGVLSQRLEDCLTYVTTMAFGPLALQVVSSHLLAPINTSITVDSRPGPWNEIITCIWPIINNQIAWQPKMGLNGELGLIEFSKRFKSDSDNSAENE